MLNDQTSQFAARVWTIASRLGNNAPRITDDLMEENFPRTCVKAREEGAFRMLRTGIVAEVKRVLRDREDDSRQRDFHELTRQFAPLVRDLKSKTYFVESAQEYVSVPDLIAEPDLLDDARRFMRRKGMECLAEANRLDALYQAVIDNDPPEGPLPVRPPHVAGHRLSGVAS